MSTLRTRVRLLFSTLAQMTGANPVLLEGEQWTEKDADTGLSTGRRKVGDGVTPFNSLLFEPTGTGGGATTEEIQDAAATLLTGGTHSGISFTYNDAANRIDATVTAAGATDLSITNRGATTLDVASSTGADVTLPAATNTQAGLATAAQITKLEGVATGATANATDAQLRDRGTHTGEQAISTITGLSTALAGKEAAGAAAAAVTAHEAAADPHPGYLTATEGNAAYQPLDADLTSIAALTTTTFGRGHLALADAAAGTAQLNAFSTTLKGLVPAPGTATGKVLSDSGSWVALGGGGDALVANPLSQFAATTSAQLRGVISDETGTDALVFANSPTLVTPALGTPSALTLTNATGLPIATGLSGLGTGIATALAVNAGSAGAPVLFGGAGGTPSSLTLTNATGLPTTGITAFNADTRAQVESALVAGSSISITPSGSGATRQLTIEATGAVGGAIPSGFAEIASPVSTTSATLVDMPGVTTTVTLAATVPIIGICSFEIETASGASSSTLGLVMTINGEDHQEHQHVLSGASDRAVAAITHRSDPLPPGTYTVKMRYRRVAGTATPGINNAALVAFAAQGAVGPTGATGTSGTKTLARFTARDNQAPAANFATIETRNSVSVLEFDAATEESAVFVNVIPEGANLSSGLLVRIWWMADTATSGNVRWAASLERGTTDLDADSFDTATEVTSAASGTSGIMSVAEITCTTIDSLTAGDLFRLRIARKAADATNDTMTGDAQLVGVEVRQVA